MCCVRLKNVQHRNLVLINNSTYSNSKIKSYYNTTYGCSE